MMPSLPSRLRAAIGHGLRALACAAWLASGGALAQELVVNGDFARGGDPPAGWVRERDTANKGTVRVQDGALELAPNSRNTPGSPKPLGLGQAIDGSALSGKTLQLSAQLGLRSPATGAVIGLHALRADGSEITKVHLRASRPDAAMETQHGTLVIPPGEKPKLLILFAVVEGEGGRAIFDGISLRDTGGPPPPIGARGIDRAPTQGTATPPAGGGAQGGGFTARVSVDAGARGREIPRALYGVNVEWWRNANGLWDESADRPQADLLAMSKALGPTMIRFPGGFLGDTYNWRQGVGPRRNRPAQVSNPGSGEKAPALFGTDEVMQFATDIGADLMMTANAGTGDARLAADWVRYVAEAQRRNARAPRAVWEIGNELYHKGDASGVTLTPEKYSERLRQFAAEMRAVDPSARLGAIGLENYPTFPFNSYRDWNAIVLQRTGDLIDFFSIHNGYAPVGPDDSARPRDVYEALWAAPLMVADNLRITAEQIRRHAPPGRADRIGIAVTEWAPLFHVNPTSTWIDHSKTLGSAVFIADMFRVFIDNPRVEMATFFKLNEPSFLGLAGMRGGKWIPNASYHAFEIFTRHFGTIAVGARAQGPTFDSARAGIVPAMKAVPLLETTASVSADGRTLFVVLINKSWDQAAQVDLAINGFEPASGSAWLLTGARPDANTGSELPRVPGIRWGRQVNVDATREFDRGAPGQIAFGSAPLAEVGRQMRYRLPAHSVVSLELRRR